MHFVIKKYWFSLTFSDSWIRFTLGTTLILLNHSWVITIKFSQHGHSSQQHWLLIEKLPKQSGSCNLTVFSEPKVLSSMTIFSLKSPFYKNLNSKEVHRRISKFFWILNSLHSNSSLFIGILNDVLFLDSFWE